MKVRTDYPPRSAVRENDGPPTLEQEQALRNPGRPGYRGQLTDLAGAQFVTLYLEEPDAEVGPGGKPLARNDPPVYRNRLRSRTTGNSSRASAGKAIRRALRAAGGVFGFNRLSNWSAVRIAGIRSWSGRTKSFAAVVMLAQPSSGFPSPCQASHRPANANSPPPSGRR